MKTLEPEAQPALPLNRRGLLTLSAAGALVSAGAVRAKEAAMSPAAASALAALDAAAKKAVDDHITPSIAIGVMKDGKMIYAKAFGSANLETDTPATASTIYKIGSNTKQFTAAAILLLQEAGALSVDDKLSKHLPDFPRAGDVTLRQMLSHTSGLGNFTNTHPPEKIGQMSRLDYDQAALLAAMAATDPLFIAPPGTVWSYSNTAYVLLGIVVEKVSGMSWGGFLKKRIFDPLSLTDTAKDDVNEVLARRASGYVDHKGSNVLFDNCSFESMSIPAGAGALRSTVGDLCAWHAALLGGKALSAASVTAMTTPARLTDGGQPYALAPAGAPKHPMNYGFGLGIGDFEGHASIAHSGGISGFVSNLQTFPKEKVSAAVLINMSGAGRPGLLPGVTAVQTAAARFGLVA